MVIKREGWAFEHGSAYQTSYLDLDLPGVTLIGCPGDTFCDPCKLISVLRVPATLATEIRVKNEISTKNVVDWA